MAAIFPPANKGGVPPGPNVCNGYTPSHAVIGEGPLYVAQDCTTILTDCQLNALTSELLAAVDKLGFGYNASQVTNLADALLSYTGTLTGSLVRRAGDTMTGSLILAHDPTQPLEAATKNYAVARAGDTMLGELVLAGSPSTLLGAVPKGYVDGALNSVIANYQSADLALQADINSRVARAGDTMTGELKLYRHPVDTMEAATKFYVDQQVAAGGGSGGGGGIPDAPSDGKNYGRLNNLWAPVVSLGGGTMTGPLILSSDPTAPAGAVTKSYADQILTIAGGKVSKAGDVMSGPLSLGATIPGSVQPNTGFGYWWEATAAFAFNCYPDSGGASRYLGAGRAGLMWFDAATGNINFSSADVGAANAATTFTKSMTFRGADGALDVPAGLKASGNTDRITFSTSGSKPQIAINGGAFSTIFTEAGTTFYASLNGYLRLPNGYIIQHGYMPGGGGAEAIWILFPTVFPGACINAQASIADAGGSMNQLYSVGVDALNTNGFSVRPRYTSGGAVAPANQPVFWIAIGY